MEIKHVKLALWNSSYLKGVGGAEKFVNDLLNSYAGKGIHQLFIISNDPDSNKVKKQIEWLPSLSNTVKIYKGSFTNPLLSTDKLSKFALEALRYFKAFIKLGFFFRKNRLDIIHLHMVNIDVLLLVFYKFLFRYKLIITFTGQELELAQSSFISRCKLRLAFRYADRVTTVSGKIKKRIQANYNFSKICTIYNGIDIKKVHRQKVDISAIPPNHFIFCGRLVSVKRVPFLVEAFSRSIQKGLQKNLYIIGDGVEKQKVRRLISSLEMEQRIFITDSFLTHAQITEIMRTAYCLLLSSISEGCPMVVLEAMSLGKPIIASNVGGLKEMVRHGTSGYLYRPDCKNLLSDYILQIERDPEGAQKMGQEGFKIIQRKFTLEKIVERYLELYRQVIDVQK